MLRYDADELNEHAQKLHGHAGTAAVRYTLAGVLVGGWIGAPDAFRSAAVEQALLITLGGNILLFGVIGFFIGRHRARSLERGAQEAMCLREIELKLRRGEGDPAA